jgi:small subunit ribosomal protein S20
MANTKSAIKRQKIAEKRHARNVAVKSATRTFVRKARNAITSDPAEAGAEILAAISALDRAAKKGVIHKNNAARRKSRLMKAYNAALQPADESAAPSAGAPRNTSR